MDEVYLFQYLTEPPTSFLSQADFRICPLDLFFPQDAGIAQVLFRKKWSDLLLSLQTHLFTVPEPEECGIATNLGFRAHFIMLGTVNLHFEKKI